MRSIALAYILMAPLTGCGVVLPYLYDASVLDDRLTLTMTRAQVRDQLGKPERVVLDDGSRVVWEYQLYAKREWTGYLIHCPFHPYCYFPGESSSPYYVAFRDDQLCLWGSPKVVRSLLRRVCVLQGPEAEQAKGLAKAGPNLSVIPVFMPPPIPALPRRLAVIPSAEGTAEAFLSWLDLTLNFLRSRHPEMVLLERQALEALFTEMGLQYGGRVDEETTVRIGKLAGADALLLYRLSTSGAANSPSATVNLRVVQIESGTTSFHQATTATAWPSVPVSAFAGPSDPGRLAPQLALDAATAFGLAALTAAFGDNPLGIVPDLSWPEAGVKLRGVLQEGPAARAGLRQGDRILSVRGQPYDSWAMPVELPASLSVRRDGETLAIRVGSPSMPR